MIMLDRTELSRLLGTIVAHENAGRAQRANPAARELVALLADAGVLPRAMGAPLAGAMAPRYAPGRGPQAHVHETLEEWDARRARRAAPRPGGRS
jgi:hypothetical protein